MQEYVQYWTAAKTAERVHCSALLMNCCKNLEWMAIEWHLVLLCFSLKGRKKSHECESGIMKKQTSTTRNNAWERGRKMLWYHYSAKEIAGLNWWIRAKATAGVKQWSSSTDSAAWHQLLSSSPIFLRVCQKDKHFSFDLDCICHFCLQKLEAIVL